ncbi:MAG: cytochrome c oxidase subunit 3 [Alphaproteobacteria bacterium]|nr:cytochrome c oxidase subunit 3 [Alphaproteobacteria bacterium]
MAQTHAPAKAHATAGGHDYHLVDPSPWPAVGALGALVTTVGAVLYMRDVTGWGLTLGILLLIYTMFAWWKDVVNEATFEGHHTPVVQIGMRYGMALFIASEVMFFVAFFWAFFDSSLFPREATGPQWPPTGIEPLDTWDIPFLNTLILLTSGTTVTWAHHEIREGHTARATKALALTAALGAIFLALQAYEYVHASYTLKSGIYGATFYIATGFHGGHVFIGTVFLIVCTFRCHFGHFKPDHHFGFEAAAWYWHFVDVVWLFLFCAVYWWGNS